MDIPQDIQEYILSNSSAWKVNGELVSGASVCRLGRDALFKNPSRVAHTMVAFHKGYANAFNAACKNGLLTVVQTLLEWRDREHIEPDNALLSAAGNRHETVIDLLLQSNIKGDGALVDLLLKWLDDPSLNDYRDGTALVNAARSGHHQNVKLLLKWLDPLETENLEHAVNWAAMHNHESIVRMLLSEYLPRNIFDGYPLCWAADERNLPIAQMLLSHGMDPDAQHSWPLGSAVHNGDEDMVRLLLDYNAITTPPMLTIAAEYGYESILHMLQRV